MWVGDSAGRWGSMYLHGLGLETGLPWVKAEVLHHRTLVAKGPERSRQVLKGQHPTRAPHSLGHSQEHVGVMFTLFQGVDTLGLPLGPCLKKDGFRPQDT